MAQFIGTHQNKLDAKGRVSIPAQFRSVLKQMSHAGEAALVAPLVLRPSHQHPCIEGWTEKGSRRSAHRSKATTNSARNTRISSWRCSATLAGRKLTRKGGSCCPVRLAMHAGLSENVIFIGTEQDVSDLGTRRRRQRLADARENGSCRATDACGRCPA